MRVAVDTNVWVSGLIIPASAPGQVIQAARDRELDVVISWQLAAELRDALGRAKLRAYDISAEDVRDLLGLVAPDLPSVDVDVELRDPDDVAVVAAAVAGRAEAIVTGDRDLLDDIDLRTWLLERGFEIVAPADLLKRI